MHGHRVGMGDAQNFVHGIYREKNTTVCLIAVLLTTWCQCHRQHVKILFGGLSQGVWRTEVPQRGPGRSPGGVWVEAPRS